VRLVFDAERRDVYDRLLAYVYLGDTFVNAELVRRGFARTLTIPPNTRFASLFDRLEQAAADTGKGLWGKCDA
jgi:micrococcal nuclease